MNYRVSETKLINLIVYDGCRLSRVVVLFVIPHSAASINPWVQHRETSYITATKDSCLSPGEKIVMHHLSVHKRMIVSVTNQDVYMRV